jgi:hypothetical protein
LSIESSSPIAEYTRLLSPLSLFERAAVILRLPGLTGFGLCEQTELPTAHDDTVLIGADQRAHKLTEMRFAILTDNPSAKPLLDRTDRIRRLWARINRVPIAGAPRGPRLLDQGVIREAFWAYVNYYNHIPTQPQLEEENNWRYRSLEEALRHFPGFWARLQLEARRFRNL